jgi:hypothetical protein
MTRRTGDALSQRVFLRGQSAIIPANFLLRKMSGHRLVEAPARRAPALTFHRKLHCRLDGSSWNEGLVLLHLRITCS